MMAYHDIDETPDQARTQSGAFYRSHLSAPTEITDERESPAERLSTNDQETSLDLARAAVLASDLATRAASFSARSTRSTSFVALPIRSRR